MSESERIIYLLELISSQLEDANNYLAKIANPLITQLPDGTFVQGMPMKGRSDLKLTDINYKSVSVDDQ